VGCLQEAAHACCGSAGKAPPPLALELVGQRILKAPHLLPLLPCSNVLLSDDHRACLADLGFAQVLGSAARTAMGGSRLYAAPEVLMGARCTLAADLFSFGVLLIELTTQQVVRHRGDWRLPRAPHDCPEVSKVATMLASKWHPSCIRCASAGFAARGAVRPWRRLNAAPRPPLHMHNAGHCGADRGVHCS
jgi:hypothetical protein